MKVAISILIGLALSVSVSAKPLIEGRVRLDSGEPIADAKVRLFDMTDLRRGAIAQATTDGAGYFALPLSALTGSALPEGFTLGLNYPNPFNPSTIIPYQLAASSQVRLEVFNLLGQRIATLVDGERPAGSHTATWTATDAAGRAVGAGVYIYRMTVGVASQTGRMVLIDGQAGVAANGVASVWSGVSGGGGSDGAGEQAYGLIVSGEGLVPYVDSAFRVEAGMAPVELVVSPGVYSAGKSTDDDCALCDLFDVSNEAESLIVYASVSDNTPTPGQLFILKARVQNQGADEFQNLVLSYYRSTDATISTQDMLLGTDEVGSLDTSSTSGDELISLKASSTSGTYYYGACVASVSDEGDTLNYCSTSVRVIVADKEDQVTIPDANLRAAIEDALGKAKGATITVAEMKTLHPLDAANQGISDLTGLEFATKLATLNLNYNNISDISPLTGLTKLTELDLWSNNIQDISPLIGLTNIQWLYLGYNNIQDMSPLTGLTELINLELGHNNFMDISPLIGLTNLQWLDLEYNNIQDMSPLTGLTNLQWLYLRYNNIRDISPLTGLTELINLELGFNNLMDISPLTGLTNLQRLDLVGNALNSFSINDHITALEHNGTTVLFDLLLSESDFDIELVFLDDHFDEKHKRVIQYAARRWMSIIREDLPDFTFTSGWSWPCGDQSYAIPSGEWIDDLRIYVVSFNDYAPYGWGSPNVLRETSHLPVVGCMGFNLAYNYVSLSTALHEIGHVLGIGTEPWSYNGFVQESSGDMHFNGPLAIAAFNDAGGWNYTGKKVPLEENWAHWRASVFRDELMSPAGGEGGVSAITIQALADLGYVVDVTQANPYTILDAAAKASAKIAAHPTHAEPEWSCGVGQQQEPIYVVDPQGHIVRTLHR